MALLVSLAILGFGVDSAVSSLLAPEEVRELGNRGTGHIFDAIDDTHQEYRDTPGGGSAYGAGGFNGAVDRVGGGITDITADIPNCFDNAVNCPASHQGHISSYFSGAFDRAPGHLAGGRR